MNSKLMLARSSWILLACCLSSAYGRNLYVDVVGGHVRKADIFSSDPYMKVTVCKQKEQTPVISSNLNPVWDWEHQFRDVTDDCRLKFQLMDSDVFSDDSLGQFQTTVGQFLEDRAEHTTLTFGKNGDSSIKVVVKYD